MQYRAWITIPGLALDREEQWEGVIERLERDYGNMLDELLRTVINEIRHR